MTSDRLKPLSERDLETLDDLCGTSDYHRKNSWRDGWVRPLDVGGSNGSHHGATLAKLRERGYAEVRFHGGVGGGARRTNYYKPTSLGRTMVQLWRSKKQMNSLEDPT